MLYPDFDELVAYKKRKSRVLHTSHRSATSFVIGDHSSPFRGQGLEFDSVREYVPGDDIRNIDWRVTARTGTPHLKLFKEDRERQVVICLDMNASMRFGTRKTFKSVQAARIAALLGWNSIALNHSVGICLFGDVPNGFQVLSSKRKKFSFYNTLKLITLPHVEKHDISINHALDKTHQHSPAGALIYLVSDFLDLNSGLSATQSLSKLTHKCDVVFISVNDKADQSMYPIGRVSFCAHDEKKVHVNTESIRGRQAYEELWNKNRQELRTITKKHKIPLLEFSTESDIHRDLILGLKSIAKRKM